MANPDIVRYINEQRSQGVPDGNIQADLHRVGWSEREVGEAFAAAGGPSVAVMPAGSSEELRAIRQTLTELSARLAKLESATGVPTVSSPVVAAAKTTAPDKTWQAFAPATGAAAVHHENAESKITGKWFAAVGVVAILFGVGFFLKYAFENGWVGETGRVVMGIIGGIVLLALGDFLSRREKYRQYSFFLSGGGLALLYLSIFAAFQFYHLIDQLLAFGFLILITAGGTLLGVRSESRRLTLMTLLGGFLTPFLVSNGTDNQLALFAYILILDLSFLVLSYYKRWMSVYLVNFLGTYAVFYSWFTVYYNADANLASTLTFLTLFHLIFMAAPFLRSALRRFVSSQSEVIATVLNAAFYFSTAYGILNARYHDYIGFFFVLFAALYLLAAVALRTRNGQDHNGILALAGAGLVLVTLAIPIQLNAYWITVSWSIEAVVLAWLGMELKGYYIRMFANVVAILTALRLLFFEMQLDTTLRDFQVVFNTRFFTYAIAVVCLFLMGYIYRVRRDRLTPGEANMPATYGVVANLLAVLALSNESVTYFNQQIAVQSYGSSPSFTVHTSFDGGSTQSTDAYNSLENQKNLSLSIIWAVYSAILMVAGILRRSRAARVLSMIGFGIVVLKVFLYDASFLSDLYRIISFITLGGLLLVVSFLFYKYKDKIKQFLMA